MDTASFCGTPTRSCCERLGPAGSNCLSAWSALAASGPGGLLRLPDTSHVDREFVVHTDQRGLVHREEADVVKELYTILPSGQRRTAGVGAILQPWVTTGELQHRGGRMRSQIPQR